MANEDGLLEPEWSDGPVLPDSIHDIVEDEYEDAQSVQSENESLMFSSSEDEEYY